jgi:hypothetical protein
MAPRERSCRQCGERYAPTRFDQAHCQACSVRLRDAHLIESALFSQPNQSVDRISIATGLSIERIRELATEGSLAAIPVGADMPTECVCPPGEYGRCAHCRSRLALRFAEASYQASKAASSGPSGMRMREPGRTRRRS